MSEKQNKLEKMSEYLFGESDLPQQIYRTGKLMIGATVDAIAEKMKKPEPDPNDIPIPGSDKRYINHATYELVVDWAEIINNRPDLKNNPKVQEAFKAFEATAKEPPAIAAYIRRKVFKGRKKGLTRKELELLMLAEIAR